MAKDAACSCVAGNGWVSVTVDQSTRDRQIRAQAEPVMAEHTTLTAQWERVCARLQQDIGDIEFRTWLRDVTFVGLDGDEITLHLPNRFLRDTVRGRYGERLNRLWQTENGLVRNVDLRVGRGAPKAAASPTRAAASAEAPRPAPARDHIASISDVGEIVPMAEASGPRPDLAGVDLRFTFDNFVVGKPNEFAYACARRVAEKPSSQGFNPLFLYGGVGLGKTHLMHAIGNDLLARDIGISVAYMSAEKFMYRFIAAIRNQSTIQFKDQLRSLDVLMIDDLQFLIGKDNTQEEFFHTFNALVEAGKQIVVSADKSPSDLSGIEDRLRTRLGCGIVADLHATTFELRISIIESKALSAGAEVPRKVQEFLAHRITTNVRELEGALNRLVAHANLFGRPVTMETTHEVLHDLLKAHDRRVTIEEIQKRVAEHYHLKLTDMSSARRARAVARPRQVAMFLAKQLTSRSLPEIGRKFGGRDHTTVMHAVTKVTELMAHDTDFAEDVELLRRMLEG